MFDETPTTHPTPFFKAGIKRLLKAFGQSRKDLCTHLSVGAAQLKKWEAGEPIMDHYIADICLHFGVSRDELFYPGMMGDKVRSSHYIPFVEDFDGYWGNVGLGLPGKKKSVWFPITLGDLEKIHEQADDTWMSFRTLANRFVTVNTNALRHLYLIDEAQDHVAGDWKINPAMPVEGLPSEIYHQWDVHCFEMPLFEEMEASETETHGPDVRLTPLAVAAKAAADADLDDDKLYTATDCVEIFMIDGRKFTADWHSVSDQIFQWQIKTEIMNLDGDLVDLPSWGQKMLALNTDDFSLMLPVKDIACVSMPDNKFIQNFIQEFADSFIEEFA